MDRTVRLGLWSGEEQGLFGSRAYVKEHFGHPKTMRMTPQQAKISGYFNLDNGSGKIRGIYLQGNEAVRPVLDSWLAPFHDMGVTTITIRNTSGTDHLSFDAVGIPAFQFIQDPLDYATITHHSNMDTYDHAIPEDLMQANGETLNASLLTAQPALCFRAATATEWTFDSSTPQSPRCAGEAQGLCPILFT
jgi:carboxypeptidase Q